MPYHLRDGLKKAVTGVILVIIAACITLFIKENLDVKNPESALPELTVSVDGMILPPGMVFRAGYEWNFWATVERNTPPYSPSDLLKHVYPMDITPRSEMHLNFSRPPKTLKVSRADDEPDHSYYVQLQDASTEEAIITPATPGPYMYKIEAGFGWRGSVVYFLMLNVKAAP